LGITEDQYHGEIQRDNQPQPSDFHKSHGTQLANTLSKDVNNMKLRIFTRYSLNKYPTQQVI